MIDEIKVEKYLIQWADDTYSQEPFYARFGILETIEQHLALQKGLDSGDKEWIAFDENVFYWITAYSGETIENHREPVNDFIYVGEREEIENAKDS